MSDEYPVEEPGTGTPTWAAVPTMPWSRVPGQRRDTDGERRDDERRDDERRDDERRDERSDPRGRRERDARRDPVSGAPGQDPRRPRPTSDFDHPTDGYPEQRQAKPPRGRTYGTPAGQQHPGQQGYEQPGPPHGQEYGRGQQQAGPNGHGDPRAAGNGYPPPGPRRGQQHPDGPNGEPGQQPRRPQGQGGAPGYPAGQPPHGGPSRRTDHPEGHSHPEGRQGAPGGRQPEPPHGRQPEPPHGRSGRAPQHHQQSYQPFGPRPGSAPDHAPPVDAPRPGGLMDQFLDPGYLDPIEEEPTRPVNEITGELPIVPSAYADAAAAVNPALSRAGVDGLQATGYLPIVRPGAPYPGDGVPLFNTPEAPIAEAPEEPAAEEESHAGPDPEQVLAAYEWRFDPDTLREQIEGEEVEELTEIRDLLTEKVSGVADNPTRARLLSLRAVVSRILGDLHKAFADGKLALAHAEATGELRRIAIAQARLAHVLQWRGEFDEADRLFTLANSTELPDRLRATMHQHAGRCAYDQGRYMEACNHFERALDLRKEEDPELIAQTALALDAVFRRVAEKGWGPYPRTRDEILQLRKPPTPAFDDNTGRWGYIDADADFCIGPRYLDVQPFRDGVAWVQRAGAQTWELIDDTGDTLIEPSAGYLGVGSFSDGLAWVSRDGQGRWIAIDKANNVLISTGFDDVRPFRRGVAAVRRNSRWGAVDGVGRLVVPFQFDGFATALYDGRYIDGFSDEGLAVVSLGQRKGVVDRTGRVVVPPVYPVLMIHPVAFLIADDAQRWGALDRRGRTIIEPTFPGRTGVIDEIDRLLADTRPVM